MIEALVRLDERGAVLAAVRARSGSGSSRRSPAQSQGRRLPTGERASPDAGRSAGCPWDGRAPCASAPGAAEGDDGNGHHRSPRHLVAGFPAVQSFELLSRRLFAHLRIVGLFAAPANRARRAPSTFKDIPHTDVREPDLRRPAPQSRGMGRGRRKWIVSVSSGRDRGGRRVSGSGADGEEGCASLSASCGQKRRYRAPRFVSRRDGVSSIRTDLVARRVRREASGSESGEACVIATSPAAASPSNPATA